MKKGQRGRYVVLCGNGVIVDRLVVQRGLSRLYVMGKYPSCANGVANNEQKEQAINEIIAAGVDSVEANEMVRLVMTPEMMRNEIDSLRAAVKQMKEKAKE